MRLTLRTLLAYLDNILDPADAELLGSKIDESEFATSLVHQIRGSVRQLRLDAPALDAQGVGGDLNSVAEYLDNVLPPDQVPALEKACLDNEVNLGEVASCHQILTLVLGEAAPVTDEMRHRAYGISPTNGARELAAPSGDPKAHLQAHPAHAPVPSPTSKMSVGPAPSSPDSNISTEPPATDLPAEMAPMSEAAHNVTETPVSTESRPSKRIASRVDAPSTKETWRAESSALHAEPETQVEQPEHAVASAAAASTTEAAPSQVSQPTARESYPDYMPRKSSWLRSVFLTGIVALLILAGLLFATGSIQDNILTRWLGKSPQVVDHATTNTPDLARQPLTPVPADTKPSQNNEINIVSPNQQQPDSVAATNVPEISVSPLDEPLLTPIETEQPTAFEPPNDDLPEMLNSNGFREPMEPSGHVAVEESVPDPPAETDTDLTRTEPNPVPPFADSESNELVSEPPTTNVNSTVVDRVEEEDPLPEVIVTDDAESPTIENSLPSEPVQDQPAVGLATEFSSATTLEPAPVDPPVAASPDVGDLAAADRLPVESNLPEVPESDVSGDMEPTKLKRDDQLLLLFDDNSSSWVRVDSKVQLKENDRLLGMPAFKSEIEIGASKVCSVHGVGRLRLGPGSDVSVLDGNIVLRNEEANQSQGIRFQGKRLDIQMIDAGTKVAIEAYHQHIPGSDISESAPHSILKIYPMDNSITVEWMGNTFDLSKGRHLIALDEYEPSVKSSRAPKWTKSDSLKPTDVSARRDWKKQLDQISDMHAWLQKKTERARANQRSLAARSLAEMDDFAAIVASLSDADQRAYWNQHFATLQRALTRGSEVQNLLKIELEKAYGSEQAILMMEMLRGYNAKQLAAGSASKLVEYLDNANLELRVLAIENLAQITGARSRYYASDTRISRGPGARAWQNRLKAGRVAYNKTPELVKLLQTYADSE